MSGEDEVAVAQGDGFFRAQRRVVQAAEERGQFRSDADDLVQDRPDLGRAGGSGRVDGYSGFARAPPHGVGGVGWQQPEFDGVGQGAVEHCPFPADCGGRCGCAVQPRAQPVQGGAHDARVAEPADRQRGPLRPGQRADGDRIRATAALGVEGVPRVAWSNPAPVRAARTNSAR